MKPKAEKENDDGLLEYLEDIVGTSKYKKLIEDSRSELIQCFKRTDSWLERE